jgi:hypothetical protein
VHLSLGDFCELVTKLDKTNAEKAVSILWYHDHKTPDMPMSAGALTKIMVDHHVGTPNSTQLAKAIRETKLCNGNASGITLKPGSRKVIQGWLPNDIEGMQPPMDHSAGYLAEAIWSNTRGYIEAVCRQLNGAFRATYYDAAAVMLRRVLETLIIEAYEHLTREAEIKDGAGNYFLLSDLVERACGEKGHAGLNLGRDSKAVLKEVRQVGNWSAHARRYNAVADDLVQPRAKVRLAVQELIQIAKLKRE